MKYDKAIGSRRMTREEVARTLAGAWRDPAGPLPLFPEEHRAGLHDIVYRRTLETLQAFPDDIEGHQLWDLHANAVRVGKWHATGMRLNRRTVPNLSPLHDRDFARLCLRLPWTIKDHKRFGDLFMRRYWPKLAHLPTTCNWPQRPWTVKLAARMPRAVTPYAYDRRRWLPLRRDLPFSARPVDQWVHQGLIPHLPAIHDFIDREMTLPLDRSAVAAAFRRFAEGDREQFQQLGTLIPLLLADGFVFDECQGG